MLNPKRAFVPSQRKGCKKRQNGEEDDLNQM